jgi:hypothetical protein
MEKESSIVTLQDLDIAYSSYCEIDDGVYIPLYIHVKDISSEYIFSDKLEKVEIIKDGIRVDKTGKTPFLDFYLQDLNKKTRLAYFKFIDSRKIFEGKKFIEYAYDCDTIEKFYDKIMNLGFTNTMFNKLKVEIEYYINKVKSEFRKKCRDFFDFDRKFPEYVKLKKEDEIPKDIEESMIYPYGMTLVQNAFEYTNSVIFKENKDKALIEYSWRENEFKVVYISMKSKIEGFTNKYQIYRTEKERNRQN